MSSVGWGIIGVPDGFQHISEGYTANKNISIVDNRVCHGDFSNESVYAVIFDTAILKTNKGDAKELVAYFAQYRFAHEMERARKGSYYGSYIACPAVYPSKRDSFEGIVKSLDLLTDYNQKNFISNNKFISDYSAQQQLPGRDLFKTELLQTLSDAEKSLTPIRNSKQKQSVIVNSDDPAEVFSAVRELYDQYLAVYCISNTQYYNLVLSEQSFIEKTIEELKQESDKVIERCEQEKIKARLELEKKLEEIKGVYDGEVKSFKELEQIYFRVLNDIRDNEEAKFKREVDSNGAIYENENIESLNKILSFHKHAISLAENVITVISRESEAVKSRILSLNPDYKFPDNKKADVRPMDEVHQNQRSEYYQAPRGRHRADYEVAKSESPKRSIIFIILSIITIIMVSALLYAAYYFSQKPERGEPITNSIVSFESEAIQNSTESSITSYSLEQQSDDEAELMNDGELKDSLNKLDDDLTVVPIYSD